MKHKIPINQPYTGKIIGHELLEDYATKIYFTDIIGREKPQLYEWKKSNLSQKKLISGIKKHFIQSINLKIPHFFIAFPHVTVGFRWGDPRVKEEIETNIHKIGLGKTPDLENICFEDVEFANPLVGCPAEIYVVGQEGIFRGESQTVQEYLQKFIPNGTYGCQIPNPNMIKEFLENK